jgi:hypothetical protein
LFIFFLAKIANSSLAWKLTQISVPDRLSSRLTDLDRQCPLRAAVQHRPAPMCHERTLVGIKSGSRRSRISCFSLLIFRNYGVYQMGEL